MCLGQVVIHQRNLHELQPGGDPSASSTCTSARWWSISAIYMCLSQVVILQRYLHVLIQPSGDSSSPSTCASARWDPSAPSAWTSARWWFISAIYMSFSQVVIHQRHLHVLQTGGDPSAPSTCASARWWSISAICMCFSHVVIHQRHLYVLFSAKWWFFHHHYLARYIDGCDVIQL